MIIGMTGRIGAGKETLTASLKEKGFTYFETSKLLSEELQKRGIEVTRTNQQNLGDELRKLHGPGVLMKMFLDKMDKDKDYIIDSLRNHHEAEFLRNCKIKFFLIAVDAPRETRFKRISERGKPSDPKTWEEFLVVDERDFDSGDVLGQNVKKCMELSDFVLMNSGTVEEFKEKVDKVIKQIEELSKGLEVKVGSRYRHYKGNFYKVLGTAFDSETLEEVVIYQGDYTNEKFGENPVFVRKKKEFLELVNVPRFKLIE